jgi:hypothetical protein
VEHGIAVKNHTNARMPKLFWGCHEMSEPDPKKEINPDDQEQRRCPQCGYCRGEKHYCWYHSSDKDYGTFFPFVVGNGRLAIGCTTFNINGRYSKLTELDIITRQNEYLLHRIDCIFEKLAEYAGKSYRDLTLMEDRVVQQIIQRNTQLSDQIMKLNTRMTEFDEMIDKLDVRIIKFEKYMRNKKGWYK